MKFQALEWRMAAMVYIQLCPVLCACRLLLLRCGLATHPITTLTPAPTGLHVSRRFVGCYHADVANCSASTRPAAAPPPPSPLPPCCRFRPPASPSPHMRVRMRTQIRKRGPVLRESYSQTRRRCHSSLWSHKPWLITTEL